MPSLVLVQPRKTHPCKTVRLLMGRKESNQTNKQLFSLLKGEHKVKEMELSLISDYF